MFGTQAFGDSANSLMQMAPLVLIFVVFYFLLIRPQQKKARDLKAMLGALRRGDRVVTGGGIIGTVAKVVNDDELLVEIAEGTRVRVLRNTITTILAKTEPVAAREDKEKPGDRASEREPEPVAPAAAGEGDKDKRRGGSLRRIMGGK